MSEHEEKPIPMDFAESVVGYAKANIKCPICMVQVLSSKKIRDGDDGDNIYCSSCGFSMSWARLVDECPICNEIRRTFVDGLVDLCYQIDFGNIEETEKIKTMLNEMGFESFDHLFTGEVGEVHTLPDYPGATCPEGYREGDMNLQDFACSCSYLIWGGDLGWDREGGLKSLYEKIKQKIRSVDNDVEDVSGDY